MIEYDVPALIHPVTGNLTDIVTDQASASPARPLLSRQIGGAWHDVTAAEFLAEVGAVAKGLVGAGVQPGDRVALMSKTRYEWTLVDFAIWFAGAVSVPIYETSSAEQVEWILTDSAAVAAIVETPEHVATIKQVHARVPALKQVWQIEAGGVDDLVSQGSDVSASVLEERRATMSPESLATLIYTSGTTGRPKGCELTHGNFLSGVYNVVEDLREVFDTPGASTLLFLPLAHVLAREIQVGCLRAGVRMGHAADIKNLVEDLSEFKPTFILSVPRVFEKVYNGAAQKAHSESAVKGKIFDAAAATAVAYSKALDAGGPGLRLKAMHGLYDKLVYGKLRAALGGQVRYAISGGAPLGARLGHFFRGVGLIVLEGYGLTETTAATTVNNPREVRIGSVGRPIPGSAIKIADDGEVLAKGGNVFRGYWNNPAATAEAIDDQGWFHTGDVGALDERGFLTLTGRKKELIVTAGGKNVAPAVLEDRLRAHVLVSQCMVVGDQRPFIGCLITLDVETLPAWLAQHGKPALTPEQAKDDPDVIAAVQQAVDDANKAVSKAEAIKKFRILPIDFTMEGGHLTPSLKLRRGVVSRDFAAEIEALYSR